MVLTSSPPWTRLLLARLPAVRPHPAHEPRKNYVEDVDAAYATLEATGVEFTKAPVDQPWGMRAAYFRDPEGNLWELRKVSPRS